MAEVFLLSQNYPQKIMQYIKSVLKQSGIECEVLNSPIKALLTVKKCFGIKYQQIPQIRIRKIGPFKLNAANYSIMLNKKFIKLRKKEFELLQFFIANPNITLNRNTILENVWGNKANPFSNTVDVHIASLRKKINTPTKTYLNTVHSIGFYFEY